MSKALNLQHYPKGETRHRVNSEYRSSTVNNYLFTDGSYSFESKSVGYGVHIKLKDGTRKNYFSGEFAENSQSFQQYYFEDIALNLGLKMCLKNNVKYPFVYIDALATYSRYLKIIGIDKEVPLKWSDISHDAPFSHRDRLEQLWGEIREMYYQLKIPRLHLINGHENIIGNEEADAMAQHGRTEAIKRKMVA